MNRRLDILIGKLVPTVVNNQPPISEYLLTVYNGENSEATLDIKGNSSNVEKYLELE